jgi:hypothetical protein
MEINPYESPREFGYLTPAVPKPSAVFDWRRVMGAVVVVFPIGVVGGIALAWLDSIGALPTAIKELLP